MDDHVEITNARLVAKQTRSTSKHHVASASAAKTARTTSRKKRGTKHNVGSEDLSKKAKNSTSARTSKRSSGVSVKASKTKKAAASHKKKTKRAVHPAAPPPEVDIPDNYICPITHNIFKDPVKAADGFTYERAAIQKWSQKHRSPMTNERLTNQLLVPQEKLRRRIDHYCADYPHLENERGMDTTDEVPDEYRPADRDFEPYGYLPGGVSSGEDDEDDSSYIESECEDYDLHDDIQPCHDVYSSYASQRRPVSRYQQCEGRKAGGSRCLVSTNSHGEFGGRDWDDISEPLRQGKKYCRFHEDQAPDWNPEVKHPNHFAVSSLTPGIRQCEGYTKSQRRCSIKSDARGVSANGTDFGWVAEPLRNGSRFCRIHQ